MGFPPNEKEEHYEHEEYTKDKTHFNVAAHLLFPFVRFVLS